MSATTLSPHEAVRVTPRASGAVRLATPSETVLLRPTELLGGQVEPGVGRPTPRFPGQPVLKPAPAGPKFQLVEGGAELPSDTWALAMLTTAFLALERHGWVRFESREMSKWAGLSKRVGLVAIPARDWPDGERWPEPSLEWQFSRISEARGVSDIVKDWLAFHSEEPGESALSRARDYLVSRGLISEEKVKRFKFFISLRYVLPVATQEDVPDATEAANLIAEYRRDRADLWRSLNDEVWRGIRSRWHDPDADYDYDFDFDD